MRQAFGVLYLDFYCVSHHFKQERGHKRVSTELLAIQKLIQHQFIKSFVFQLGQISQFEKIKVFSIEHLKQKLSLITTNVIVIMTFTSQKQYCFRCVGMLY